MNVGAGMTTGVPVGTYVATPFGASTIVAGGNLNRDLYDAGMFETVLGVKVCLRGLELRHVPAAWRGSVGMYPRSKPSL